MGALTTSTFVVFHRHSAWRVTFKTHYSNITICMERLFYPNIAICMESGYYPNITIYPESGLALS